MVHATESAGWCWASAGAIGSVGHPPSNMRRANGIKELYCDCVYFSLTFLRYQAGKFRSVKHAD